MAKGEIDSSIDMKLPVEREGHGDARHLNAHKYIESYWEKNSTISFNVISLDSTSSLDI